MLSLPSSFSDLERDQSVVEFPVAVGAKGNKVIEGVDNGDRAIVREVLDRTDVAYFDVLGIPTFHTSFCFS